MVVNPHIFKNMKVDPLTAFDPITLITAAPLVLVVPTTPSSKTFVNWWSSLKKTQVSLTMVRPATDPPVIWQPFSSVI